MRFHFPAFFSVALLFVSAPAAQKNRDPEIHKRIAEIQQDPVVVDFPVEIAEVHQEPVLVTGFAGHEGTFDGIIAEVFGGEETSGFCIRVPCVAYHIQLRPNAQIMFSDGKKANASDLKIGQQVRVGVGPASSVGLMTNPPIYPREGYVVVIKKANEGAR